MQDLLTDYSTGYLETIALDMLNKFRRSEGGIYRNSELNKIISRTEQFQNWSTEIIKVFKSDLEIVNGDLSKLTPRTLSRIDFSKFRDKLNGLGILIHQMYAAKAEIKSLNYDKKSGQYSGSYYALSLPKLRQSS